MTAPAPDGNGARRAMLQRTRRRPASRRRDVGYINAHGTSTQLGDAAETRRHQGGLRRRRAAGLLDEVDDRTPAGRRGRARGGHLRAARMRDRRCCRRRSTSPTRIPPAISTTCRTSRARPTSTPCMSNSFGFGGHNATLVFAPRDDDRVTRPTPSARRALERAEAILGVTVRGPRRFSQRALTHPSLRGRARRRERLRAPRVPRRLGARASSWPSTSTARFPDLPEGVLTQHARSRSSPAPALAGRRATSGSASACCSARARTPAARGGAPPCSRTRSRRSSARSTSTAGSTRRAAFVLRGPRRPRSTADVAATHVARRRSRALQELTQARAARCPTYRIVDRRRAAARAHVHRGGHRRRARSLGTGSGRSKKDAEKAAAAAGARRARARRRQATSRAAPVRCGSIVPPSPTRCVAHGCARWSDAASRPRGSPLAPEVAHAQGLQVLRRPQPHARLEPGVTVVVGPNGSGKSNISDAVLWVLGEQSAKTLRGNSMEDVIFAGSSARQAVGVAEVDLVLDNSRRHAAARVHRGHDHAPHVPQRRERVPASTTRRAGSWTCTTSCTTRASAATRTRSSARAASTRS